MPKNPNNFNRQWPKQGGGCVVVLIGWCIGIAGGIYAHMQGWW